MNTKENINCLFLDIGGVLLTSGWDRKSRQQAVIKFELDEDEINERHHLTFDVYEAGKLSLDEYLDRVVFYRERNFSKDDFKTFMFEQTKPIEGSIELFKSIKEHFNLKVIAVNNEARELNLYRIQKFNLDQLFDAYISSCYVHLRKPDVEIFRMACDVANTSPKNILYIDDRIMFVEVANSLEIRGYQFQDVNEARIFLNTINFSESDNKKNQY
jgi:putative hydrolase of the HAD superfamily